MSKLPRYQRQLENLSSNETTVRFILNEIQKMSQVEKIKQIVEMLLIKNIRGLKYQLPQEDYQRQLEIVDQLITPLKFTVDAELAQFYPTGNIIQLPTSSHRAISKNQESDNDNDNQQSNSSKEQGIIGNFDGWN